MVKLFFLWSIIFLFGCSLAADTRKDSSGFPGSLLESIEKADIESAQEHCADLVFSTEDAGVSARANVVFSILQYLGREKVASSRAESTGMFYKDSEIPEEEAAAKLLLYLGDEIKADELWAYMKKKSPDWRATAAIAGYVKSLNDSGPDPEKLNRYVKEYMDATGQMDAQSWGNIWTSRLATWQTALQKKDVKGDLEKLIAEEMNVDPSGSLRERVRTLSGIYGLFLAGKRKEALAAAGESLGELESGKGGDAEAYSLILKYLSGENIYSQEIYEAAKSNPDMFVMGAVGAFIGEFVLDRDGDIHKSVLAAHLDNYISNSGNAELEEALAWKKRVENWKKWSLAGCPKQDGLAPLLSLHSRAIADKDREKTALSEASELLSSLQSSVSLSEVALDDFKKVRHLFKGRPKPEDFDFESLDIQNHLEGMPFEARQGEWLRYRYMKTFKKKIVDMLDLYEYKGLILLKNKKLRGRVVQADKDTITVKTDSSVNKYKWSEFRFEQIPLFVDYYLNSKAMRIEGKGNNIFSTKIERIREHYSKNLMLAIMCDWYGKYEESLKYGGAAEKYSDDKTAVRKLLLK